MLRKETYKTKQKDLITDIIKQEKKEFTIKDIYEKIKSNTGLTTIYRLVDKLVEEGKIKKYIDNNTTYYQYLEECDKKNHFYLKCKNFKKLEHIDCDCIEELSNHILKKHNFNLEKNIIITGLCKKCKRGE